MLCEMYTIIKQEEIDQDLYKKRQASITVLRG